MVLNTGNQQYRSKLACSTPVNKIQKPSNDAYTVLQTPNDSYNLKFFIYANED